MPATNEEFFHAAYHGTPEAWLDGTPLTDEDRGNLVALRRYIDRYTANRKMLRSASQRKAMRLLRSLLSREQAGRLRRNKHFLATGASGATYRFFPRSGHVELVTKHGRNWFALTAYCVHDDRDDPDAMPPADLTVAHLLMVLADDPGFLATANARDMRTEMWNGDYLRRMRRRERTA